MIQSPLVILTGPSGSGKDAVMNSICASGLADRVITHTDRPIRPGETQDVDYHFVSTQKFTQLISTDYFLEYVIYSGTYRGTAKDAIFPKSLPLIWRIDSSRAGQIVDTFKSVFPETVATDLLARTVLIYLQVNNPKTLFQRILARDPHISQTEIQLRYQQDQNTWELYQDFFRPNVVYNEDGQLPQTIENVLARIRL